LDTDVYRLTARSLSDETPDPGGYAESFGVRRFPPFYGSAGSAKTSAPEKKEKELTKQAIAFNIVPLVRKRGIAPPLWGAGLPVLGAQFQHEGGSQNKALPEKVEIFSVCHCSKVIPVFFDALLPGFLLYVVPKAGFIIAFYENGRNIHVRQGHLDNAPLTSFLFPGLTVDLSGVMDKLENQPDSNA
jgi:hypothetical protein